MRAKKRATKIPAPPKGTRIMPGLVHRNITTIVDVWRNYSRPSAEDVTTHLAPLHGRL